MADDFCEVRSKSTAFLTDSLRSRARRGLIGILPDFGRPHRFTWAISQQDSEAGCDKTPRVVPCSSSRPLPDTSPKRSSAPKACASKG